MQPWSMRPDPVLEVLKAYPQVFHACHLRHPRARTNAGRISARDAWILGHLDRVRPMSPTELARHLSLRGSTVSEALRRLEPFLAPRGADALKGATVLDAGRVERLLARLSKHERLAAVRGLLLLARAARSLNKKEPKQWNKRDA